MKELSKRKIINRIKTMDKKQITYEEFVMALCKPGSEIKEQLDENTAHILHMAVGISGEAGEILDAVKKAAIYLKELNKENLIEELGDIEFYLEGLRQKTGITREETIRANMEKLTERYKKLKYSNSEAQEIKDKKVLKGYTLKQEHLDKREAARAIVFGENPVYDFFDKMEKLNKLSLYNGIMIMPNSRSVYVLEKEGVLKEWFEEVYF